MGLIFPNNNNIIMVISLNIRARHHIQSLNFLERKYIFFKIALEKEISSQYHNPKSQQNATTFPVISYKCIKIKASEHNCVVMSFIFESIENHCLK
jgi:hypothetical protein